MSEQTKSGSVRSACFCEGVQYEIEMPTELCVRCHCTMCRRAHGAGYTTWVILPTKQLQIHTGKDKLTHCESFDHGSGDFCSVCGSELFGWSTRTPEQLYLRLGNLKGEIDRSPQAHVGFENRVPWITVADDLPRVTRVGDLETK
jgi:hypothetical protein